MLWKDICVLNCVFTFLTNFLWVLTVDFSPRKNRNHSSMWGLKSKRNKPFKCVAFVKMHFALL